MVESDGDDWHAPVPKQISFGRDCLNLRIARPFQMRRLGNTVDLNENENAVSTFEDRLAAVRKLEATVVQ